MTTLPSTQTSAQQVLESYLYVEYSLDEDLQAFVATYNSMAQGYVNWFLSTPLAVYTLASISGPLLDWVGTYLYGIPRPVLSTIKTYSIGAVATFFVGQIPVAGAQEFSSGSATPATDDIYKRVLTWWFYRGDGKQTSIDWLKRRVTRFMYGANGTDVVYPYSTPPSITVNQTVFTITVPNTTAAQALQILVAQGNLALPFENQFTVIIQGTVQAYATTYAGTPVLAGGKLVELGVP